MNALSLFAARRRALLVLPLGPAILALVVSALKPLPAAASEESEAAKAIKTYEEAVKKSPDDADLWYNLAVAYKMAKKWTAAADPALKAATLAPQSAEKHVLAGEVLKQAGRPSEAITQLEAAIKIAPDMEAAQSILGDVYYDGGRLEEAVTAYKAAIKALPSDDKDHDAKEQALWSQIGASYLKKGDAESATKWLGKSLEKNPNDPAAHYNLGQTYRSLGEKDHVWYEKATDELVKASDLDPKDAKAALFAADTALLAGKKDVAKTYLDKYFKLDPDGSKVGADMREWATEDKEELAKGGS